MSLTNHRREQKMTRYPETFDGLYVMNTAIPYHVCLALIACIAQITKRLVALCRGNDVSPISITLWLIIIIISMAISIIVGREFQKMARNADAESSWRFPPRNVRALVIVALGCLFFRGRIGTICCSCFVGYAVLGLCAAKFNLWLLIKEDRAQTRY